MFVVQELSGETPKKLFNDRKRLMGRRFERTAVLPLVILATLTVASAYTIFSMQEEKNVKLSTNLVAITPAQEKLLQFISEIDPKLLKKAIRRVKDNVLYLIDLELDQRDREACFLVNLLERSIAKISNEQKHK